MWLNCADSEGSAETKTDFALKARPRGNKHPVHCSRGTRPSLCERDPLLQPGSRTYTLLEPSTLLMTSVALLPPEIMSSKTVDTSGLNHSPRFRVKISVGFTPQGPDCWRCGQPGVPTEVAKVRE